MDSLPLMHRIRGRTVLVVGTGDAADAKRRLVEAAGGVVADAPDGGVSSGLAFVALDDVGAVASVSTSLRAAGYLVNVVDRPALCDFTVPAIVDRAPVTVAIGTGGASATLAKALRERLEALLPAGLGRLAEALFAARDELKRRYPDPAQRRRALDGWLVPGGALDPFGGGTAIPAHGDDGTAPVLVRVAAASADPDDLTLRQLRALSAADQVWHPAGTPPALLDRARRDAVRVVSVAPPDPLPAGLTVWLDLV